MGGAAGEGRSPSLLARHLPLRPLSLTHPLPPSPPSLSSRPLSLALSLARARSLSLYPALSLSPDLSRSLSISLGLSRSLSLGLCCRTCILGLARRVVDVRGVRDLRCLSTPFVVVSVCLRSLC